MAQVRDASGNGVIADVGSRRYIKQGPVVPSRFEVITASNFDLANGPCIGILCTTAGVITVTCVDDPDGTTKAITLVVGEYRPMLVRRITSVGSGAFAAAY